MSRTMARAAGQNEIGSSGGRRGDRSTKGPKQVDAHVGLKIRNRRMELSLSQTSLGKEVGVSFQQMQKYEKGMNRVGASRLAAIAGALEVPVRYFFPDDDLEMPPVTGEVGVRIAELERHLKVMHRELARLRHLQ